MSTGKSIELRVLHQTLKFLIIPSSWEKNSEFNEICNMEGSKFTLGCALEKAQLEIRGEKKNRSKEMGIIRRCIYFNYFWRAGIHPITYFNRNSRTSHDDIVFVLQKCISKLN